MTDEVLEQEEAATEETTPEKPTGSNQSQKQGFSQEEVNKIVAKEKASWKRQNEKASADHETIVEGLRKDITARDEVIQSQVDLLKKDLELDEITAELLSEKDPLDQFKMLVKIIEKQGKEEIPRTPKGNRKQSEFHTNFNASV